MYPAVCPACRHYRSDGPCGIVYAHPRRFERPAIPTRSPTNSTGPRHLMLLQAATSTAADSTAATVHTALFVALAIFTLIFLVVVAKGLRDRKAAGDSIKSPASIWAVSFVANFFDTLGIGSYATTTSM